MSKIFFDKIPVMQVTDEMNARFRSAVNDIQNVYSKSKAMAIDSMIFEDFMRPKIIWKRIGSILRFSYDTTGNLGLDSTCFATGQHMAYLCCILNSLMGHYMFKDSPKTGTGDLLVSVQAIEPILIPMNKDMECLFENLLEEVLEHRSEETEKEINRLAFKLYDLSPAEINYITDFVTQSQQSQ